MYNNDQYKVWESKILVNKSTNTEPGKVVDYKNGCPIIKCGKNSVVLLKIQPKIKLKIGEYL